MGEAAHCTMKKTPWLSLLALALFLVLGMSATNDSVASAAQEPSCNEQGGFTAHLDPSSLTAFVDRELPSLMKRFNIPGASVAVTEGCRTVLLKGYGFADIEGKEVVEPRRHLFRIASISKLFVWTSVMQLVEAGELDLHVDINQYLDFTIPRTFEQPITLWNLLTHTPGFEDSNIGGSARSIAELVSLGEALKAEIPRRVAPAGEYTAYSNYGAALAGYIVQRISGQPYYEYAENHIFHPLGMSRTTLRQPVEKKLRTDMVHGYTPADAGYARGSFEFMKRYPDGGALSTAEDMARFAKAHLMGAATSAWLEERTRKVMHSHQFSNIPQVAGVTLGFIEGSYNGVRTIGHGGDIDYFSSKLYLVPSAAVSVFIAFNSDATGSARAEFMQRFMDQYFPGTGDRWGLVSREPVANAAVDVEGSYVSSRRNYSTIEKLVWPLLTGVSVKKAGDGSISVSVAGDVYSYTRREKGIYVPSANDTAASAELGAMIVTESPDSGRRSLYFSRLATFYFDETVAYESLTFNLILLIGSLAVLVAASVMVLPIPGGFRKRARELNPTRSSVIDRCVALLILSGLGIVLLFIVALPQVLTQELIYGATTGQKMVFWLPATLFPIAIAMAALLYAGTRRGTVSRKTILSGSLACAGMLVLLCLFGLWNMIGSFGIPDL